MSTIAPNTYYFLGYDIVEWLAAQEWSNGKVGMYGASAYAIVQWFTAAEQPPHLAVSQLHRERCPTLP